MKKKLLEKDVFYLSLFICICVISFGGLFIANDSLNKLLADNKSNKDSEINLVKEDDKLATSTKPNQTLEEAKKQKEKEDNEKKESKLSYIGDGIQREYSETVPTYSKTLDAWEIHKALDVSAQEGADVRSIQDGTVVSIYSDEEYGKSIEMSYADGLNVVYSGIVENPSIKKGDKVKEGDTIAYVGNTTNTENEDGTHVHIEAYKNKVAINPLGLLE